MPLENMPLENMPLNDTSGAETFFPEKWKSSVANHMFSPLPVTVSLVLTKSYFGASRMQHGPHVRLALKQP